MQPCGLHVTYSFFFFFSLQEKHTPKKTKEEIKKFYYMVNLYKYNVAQLKSQKTDEFHIKSSLQIHLTQQDFILID